MSLVRREMVSQNSFNANDSAGPLMRRTSANDGANIYSSQFASGDVDSLADSSREYKPPSSSFSTPKQNGVERSGLADFFGGEVFRIVLHNPTTAHRLKKFSQARMCGENMEFLEQVDRYNGLLDELATIMTEVHYSFTGPDAPKQIGVPTKLLRKINADIKTSSSSTLPSMEKIFSDAQENVENILRTSIYPRFVKYQMTHSASKALSTDRSRFQGLGDCFVFTDPNKADNPIVYASDGFVSVTGYTRQEIIPRNCRFLQGTLTDRTATRRLRESIEAREETVELLLNYKKTSEPFWNLLLVAPLFDSNGRVAFFIGGQINCSTTIKSNTDLLKLLAMSDDPEEDEVAVRSILESRPRKRSFFGFGKKDNTPKPPASTKAVEVREAGMEQGLLKQIEKMNIRTQMEVFYTAYSKYLVIKYDNFTIQFYSLGIIDVLGITNRTSQDFVGNNIFKFLGQHTSSLSRDYKSKVKESLRRGQPISISINLFTLRSLARQSDDKFFTHWTPCKDENGATKFVVITLSSTLYE